MKRVKSRITIIALFIASSIIFSCNSNQEKNWYTEKLSKDNTVLVLVDFLTGFDPAIKTIDTLTLYHNVTAFAKIGQIFKLPTIVLGDEGGFRGNFYSAIKKYTNGATFIERQTPSAWRVDEFKKFLTKANRKKILLGGISLDNCVLQTSLDLLANGYEVYVCIDVSPCENELVYHSALMRLQQAGAILVTWGSIAGEIMGDWRTPEANAVGNLYKEHSVYGGVLKPIIR